MPYVDRTVFTTNDQSSGEVADPNKLEANDSHLADVVDANYSELYNFVNGENISRMGVLNVKDYGAKGDGTTDDTSSIQEALDRIASNGGMVFFPVGEYPISATLNVKEKTILKGSGISNTVIRRNDNDITMFKAEGNYISNGSHISHVEFHDMNINNTDTFQTSPGIELKAVSHFLFKNVKFNGLGIAVHLKECFDSRINNCIFDWCGREENGLPAIKLDHAGAGDNTNEITFFENMFHTFNGSAIEITEGAGGTEKCNQNRIISCKFETNRFQAPSIRMKGSTNQIINSVFTLSNISADNEATQTSFIEMSGWGHVVSNNKLETMTANIDVATNFIDISNLSNSFIMSNWFNGLTRITNNAIGSQSGGDTRNTIQFNQVQGTTGDTLDDAGTYDRLNRMTPFTITNDGRGEVLYNFETEDESHQWVWRLQADGLLKLYNYSLYGTSSPLLQFKPSGSVKGLITEDLELSGKLNTPNGSTRPSNPKTGTQFFDTSLGQPIWHNGTDWVDSSGTIV